MAKYIDAEKGLISAIQIKTGCNFLTASEIVDSREPADVIERSKIDKAIEEIDFLRQHRAKYITEDNRICIDSGEVLEILKRNIRE